MKILRLLPVFLFLLACKNEGLKDSADQRIKIIIDTDANNELDDQHALAYAFCNAGIFDLQGVTVNNTIAGDGIEGHYREALRVARLCGVDSLYPIFRGATGSYREILPFIDEADFDGRPAVDFIVQKAYEQKEGKLTLVPIGKLTNIALAIRKDPGIIEKVRVLWLGSNFPDMGEYNLENDTSAVNPVIQSGVEFAMAIVAYGRMDGTSAVSIPIAVIEQKMPGLGPQVETPVEGRNGGVFHNFGDYAIDLWRHMELYGEQKERALFDLAAVAVVKNPGWAEKDSVKAPVLKDGKWITGGEEVPGILIYKNFRKDSILNDLFHSLEYFQLKP